MPPRFDGCQQRPQAWNRVIRQAPEPGCVPVRISAANAAERVARVLASHAAKSACESPPVQDGWRTAVNIAPGVTRDGKHEVLGLWIAYNEGARFWPMLLWALRASGQIQM